MNFLRKSAKNIAEPVFLLVKRKTKTCIFKHFAHVCVNLRKRVRETSKKRRLFFVQKEEIVANGYDLSLNKYKQVEYTPVEYPPTQQLMTELHELEMQISAGLAELEEML